MKIEKVKVGEIYLDKLHNILVYCTKIHEKNDKEDSYIDSLYLENGSLSEISVFTDNWITKSPDGKEKDILKESIDNPDTSSYTKHDGFKYRSGDIILMPGCGIGVIFVSNPNFSSILTVTEGILEEVPISIYRGMNLYPAEQVHKEKFHRMLRDNGFYYDEKFKYIFKKGDSKENIMAYMVPPRMWSCNNIATTINGGFIGVICKDESSYFDTVLMGITSDNKSTVKIKFKSKDLRVPSEEEVENFRDRIDRSTKEVQEEIEKYDDKKKYRL